MRSNAARKSTFSAAGYSPLLARQWGAALGVIVPAVVYSAAHVATGRIHGSLAMLNVFLAGALFGLLALRTGGLAAPFAAHLAWNWLERAVFGMTPNPGVDRLGALIDIDLVGPALVSGGRDEFNGTLEVALALALALAVVAVVSAVRVERVPQLAPSK